MSKIELYNADCLEKMKDIPSGSVDMILCDLPYGTTSCKWDTIIPFEPLWEQYNRIIKLNGCIALFGSEPFSSNLRLSNLKNYKYDWIWLKQKAGNFQLVKKQPLKVTENISVFNSKVYNPIPRELNESTKSRYKYKTGGDIKNLKHMSSGKYKYNFEFGKELGYPKNILEFKQENKSFHPTQKPVALLEYLIKTYTLEGETVLDNTMGSGSTGVACKNLNRSFIGIEKDEGYFKIAKDRIENHVVQRKLF